MLLKLWQGHASFLKAFFVSIICIWIAPITLIIYEAKHGTVSHSTAVAVNNCFFVLSAFAAHIVNECAENIHSRILYISAKAYSFFLYLFVIWVAFNAAIATFPVAGLPLAILFTVLVVTRVI